MKTVSAVKPCRSRIFSHPLRALCVFFVLSLLFAADLESALVADYRFEDSLENSLASGSALVHIGGGNAFDSETVYGESQRVLQFPAGGGVRLDNLSSLLTDTGTYTVAIQFRFDTVSGYRKILDFKNRSLDSGFYCLSGNANFYSPSHTGEGTPITAGEYVLVILTRDASNNVVRAYVNGAEQFMFTDSTSRAVVDGNDRWIFFQDDTPTGGREASSGAVAQIQIFDRALSTNEIADFEFAEGSPTENPPVAQDSAFAVAEGSFRLGAVTATSEDGSPLTFSLVTGPERGTLTFNADGSYNYAAHRQPTIGFIGTDSFTFLANDGNTDSNEATVTATITPVNDAPVAQDSTFTVASGATYTGTVSATDVDGDALTFAVVTGPSHGTLTFVADGSFSYQAAAGFTGTDSFTFLASDGNTDSNVTTVTATITPQTQTVVLTFEGLGDMESVNQYYNGGLGGAGSGPGPNYGVSFSENGLALIRSVAGGSGGFSNEPSPDTVLLFDSGDATTMNVPAGFQTGFSFYYASNQDGQIRLYDGLDATGNLLATMDLPATPNPYTEFVPIGVTFSGSAYSVDFAGGAIYCLYDNITLGSAIPGDSDGQEEQGTPISLGAEMRLEPSEWFPENDWLYAVESSEPGVVAAQITPEGQLLLEALGMGTTLITVTATHVQTQEQLSHEFWITVVGQPDVLSSDFRPFESWNPRFEQLFEVQNTSGFDAIGVRLLFSDLADGITVENQTGVAPDGRVMIDWIAPFPDGATETLSVVYLATGAFRPDQHPPTVEIQFILSQHPGAPENLGAPMISDFQILPDGRKMLEFSSLPGRTYMIEHSDDGPAGPWTPVTTLMITAGANRTQWLDAGPPTIPLSTTGTRFYRVREVLP